MSAVRKAQREQLQPSKRGDNERRRTTKHSGIRIANSTKRRIMQFLGERLLVEDEMQSAGLGMVVVSSDCRMKLASGPFRNNFAIGELSDDEDVHCSTLFSQNCNQTCSGIRAIESGEEISEIIELKGASTSMLARIKFIPFCIGEENFFLAMVKNMEIEQKLIEMERLAQAGALMGGLAHDMNNALSAILGNLGYMEASSGIRERAGSAISDIRDAVEAGARLCKDMAHLASKHNPIEVTSISILAEKALRLVSHEIKSVNSRGKEVVVSINIPKDIIASIPAVSVQRCIMNIMMNAIQHGMKDDGSPLHIEVEAAQLNNTIYITIANNGKMIPLHIQEKLLREIITDPSSYNGVGMFSYARIIEMIGGRLTFDSNPMRTAFNIEIPVKNGGLKIAK